MESERVRLSQRIDYHFNDDALLRHALSHRSTGDTNNERLEFLGDAILNMLIAEVLFQHHPDAMEGELSRMRALLVSGESLAGLARQLELGNDLNLGAGEIKSGGRERESILADALEALIGAIYLDSDLDTCRQCILKWYGDRLNQLRTTHFAKDAKSHLQEWTQAHKFPLPTYKATISGKAHAQIFTVVCEVVGLPHVTTGVSTNRRKAEQLAASHYLKLLS
jgi:ribonuclease III